MATQHKTQVAYFWAILSFPFLADSIVAKPIEIVIPRDPIESLPVSPERQKEAQEAIERGLKSLRLSQLKHGSWSSGALPQQGKGGLDGRAWAIGYAALPGLTLLECGINPADPAIQQAARFVRTNVLNQTRTYEISLAIMFLDKLGEPNDPPLIRTLALRLAAGQGPLGGWNYNCPLLTPVQERQLMEVLLARQAGKGSSFFFPDPKVMGTKAMPRDNSDNSNTQFAMLALYNARKYELPLDSVFSGLEQRFRLTQLPNGWDYKFGYANPYGSMTCVGLLALSVGRGTASLGAKPGGAAPKKQADEAIAGGLRSLAALMNDPTDTQGLAVNNLGPKGTANYYFLWSVERVGVVCNLDTIGGKNWYRWGVDVILPSQRKDGSWLGRGSGGFPQIDTCFALLFLKKSDLLPDLRETLQKRLTIVDPGPPDLKGAIDPRKKTGDKSDPKKGIKDSPGDKEMAKEVPLPAGLGEIKVGQGNRVPLRVRGPGPYKITKIAGEDKEVLIDLPDDRKEVHELIVLLRPQKTGVLRRTLIFMTDIPGRPEVAIEIKATVVR